MAVKGTITLNEVDILEIDQNPTVSPGQEATVGTLALLNEGTSARIFQKIFDGDINWLELGVSNMTQTTLLLEDWIAGAISGNAGWITTTAGIGSSAQINNANSNASKWGIAELTPGTLGTSSVNLNTGVGSIALGAAITTFVTSVQFPNLSGASGRTYISRIGLGDTSTGDFVDGVYFEYNQAANGNVWAAKTASNSTRTTSVSASSIAAATWYNLRCTINNAGTSAQFAVNGIVIATITTNIPINPRKVAPAIQIVRTAGSANSVLVDYYSLRAAFNPLR